MKRAETSVILIIFGWCPLRSLHLFCYLLSLHESGTRKIISWSVTVYNRVSTGSLLIANLAIFQLFHVYSKNFSSQYSLTAQIKLVQDKIVYWLILDMTLYVEIFFVTVISLWKKIFLTVNKRAKGKSTFFVYNERNL